MTTKSVAVRAAVGRWDEIQRTHRPATAGTERHGSRRRGVRSGVAPVDGPAGMALHAGPVGAGGGMTEAVVSDGPEAAREVARDKLHAWQDADLAAVARRPVLPSQADGVIVDADHAGVAEGGSGDIRPEILEGGKNNRRCTEFARPAIHLSDVAVDVARF